MRIWEYGTASNIGYTGAAELPFIDLHFLAYGPESLSESGIASLIHELEHALALTGLLGWVVASRLARVIQARGVTQLMVTYGKDTASLCQYEQQQKAWDLYLENYSEDQQVLEMLDVCLRPLLEGMAVFAQLDFIPSPKTVPGASRHWAIIFAVLMQGSPGKRLAEPLCSKACVKSVEAFYARVTQKTLRNLTWTVLSDAEPTVLPYRAGYMLIKGLQRRLAQQDVRLADPERYLTLLHGVLFNDRGFLPCFLEPLRSQIYDFPGYPPLEDSARLTGPLIAHLIAIFHSMVNAAPAHLDEAIRRIDTPASFSENVYSTDFLSGLLEGDFADTRNFLEHISKRSIQLLNVTLHELIQAYAEQLAGHDPALEQNNSIVTEIQTEIKKLHEMAVNCQTLLPGLQSIIPLHHTRRWLLAVGPVDAKGQLPSLWHFPDSGATLIAHFPSSSLDSLLNQVTCEGLAVVRLTDQDPSIDTLDGAELAGSLQAAGSPCEVADDLLLNTTNCQVLWATRRKQYLHVKALLGDVPLSIKQESDIRELLAHLDDRLVWQGFLDKAIPNGRGQWPQTVERPEFVLLAALWKIVFPNASADQNTLICLWQNGFNAIMDAQDSQLIEELVQRGSRRIVADPALLSRIMDLNRRWSHRVGDGQLITIGDEADGYVVLTLDWF